MVPFPSGFSLARDAQIPFEGALALVRLTDWHATIAEPVFRTACAHSLCFAARAETPVEGWPHEVVAFARVVTDRATYAYLCDVIVHPGVRGRGLSHALVRATLAHPDLGGVRRYTLLSRQAPDLYRRHGFTELHPAVTYLERLRSPA